MSTRLVLKDSWIRRVFTWWQVPDALLYRNPAQNAHLLAHSIWLRSYLVSRKLTLPVIGSRSLKVSSLSKQNFLFCAIVSPTKKKIIKTAKRSEKNPNIIIMKRNVPYLWWKSISIANHCLQTSSYTPAVVCGFTIYIAFDTAEQSWLDLKYLGWNTDLVCMVAVLASYMSLCKISKWHGRKLCLRFK